MVRPQPMQTFCASSVQTLMQGDSTRGSGTAGGVMAMGPSVELWGSLAYSSNAFCRSRALQRLAPHNERSASQNEPRNKHVEEISAMHPLTTVKGAITTGVRARDRGLADPHQRRRRRRCNRASPPLVGRWLHIVAGVMWIGLLYYFNVVQIPGLADAAADKGGPGGAGITKYIAPRALWWFRWAAVATWLTGAYYLLFGYGGSTGALHKAFDRCSTGFVTIGVGAWLGTIMLFNVWGLIWPNQKKILASCRRPTRRRRRRARSRCYASRTNFILSVPMLMCMGGQSHGLPF